MGSILLWIIGVLLFLIVGFFLFWRLYFLRQPTRVVPKGKGIVSPANGKVVRIIPFTKGTPLSVPKGMLGMVRTMTKDVSRDGFLVVIMLTPMDVHYQRAPVDGTILKTQYTKGKFANAVSGAADLRAFENEKNEILIASGKERVKVVQVAGFLARRIVCAVDPGHRVKKGAVIGLINLGSQTLLIIPKKKILVKEGQMVIDGETVIAR